MFVTCTQFCTLGQLNLTKQQQQHNHTWTLADYFMCPRVNWKLRVKLLLKTVIIQAPFISVPATSVCTDHTHTVSPKLKHFTNVSKCKYMQIKNITKHFDVSSTETVRGQQNWIIVRGLPSSRQKWGALNHLSLCSKSTLKQPWPVTRSNVADFQTFNHIDALDGLVNGFILIETQPGESTQRDCFSTSLYSSVSCNQKFLQSNLIPNYFNIQVS